MDDMIMSLKQAQLEVANKNLRNFACNFSFLASNLAETYSVFYYADDSTDSPVNPFGRCSQNANTNKAKYLAAFVAKNLYVDLEKLFKKKGFVVEHKDSSIPTFNSHSICDLAFYPGISYIFIVRERQPAE